MSSSIANSEAASESFCAVSMAKRESISSGSLRQLHILFGRGVSGGCSRRIFPKPTTVYYPFRKWSESTDLQRFLQYIVTCRRKRKGKNDGRPSVAFIDSQSVRAACAQSQKGIEVSKECVKSNSGTSEFRPLEGRWVVERTFSWLDNYRRLCRNYERYLTIAKTMVYFDSILFMLRYF